MTTATSGEVGLHEFFALHTKAALGFSGGVDSSYLLYAALQSKADIRPYFVKSPFQPMFELEDAKRLAGQLGCEITVLELDNLTNPLVAGNSADRCYHCKTMIFTAIKERALADGYTLLLDGNNASDDAGDRPGMKAAEELEVRSPLRECCLSKAEIRTLSKEAGLFTWDKPAYACLATRVKTGVAITHRLLERVEMSEDLLFSLGFSDIRVRTDGENAKLQVPAAQMQSIIDNRERIYIELKKHFADVMLDLKAR
jgi:uncharacterized protein